MDENGCMEITATFNSCFPVMLVCQTAWFVWAGVGGVGGMMCQTVFYTGSSTLKSKSLPF